MKSKNMVNILTISSILVNIYIIPGSYVMKKATGADINDSVNLFTKIVMANEQTLKSNMNLTVKTHNSRGLNSSKKDYVVNILSDCDFLFIQDHWLSSAS